jgi:hypothetical protein
MKINLFWDVRQSVGYFDTIFSYSVSFWVSVFYNGSFFFLYFADRASRNDSW